MSVIFTPGGITSPYPDDRDIVEDFAITIDMPVTSLEFDYAVEVFELAIKDTEGSFNTTARDNMFGIMGMGIEWEGFVLIISYLSLMEAKLTFD